MQIKLAVLNHVTVFFSTALFQERKKLEVETLKHI